MDRRKVYFGHDTYHAYQVTIRILSHYNLHVGKLADLLKNKADDYYLAQSIAVTGDYENGYLISFGCNCDVKGTADTICKHIEEAESKLEMALEMDTIKRLLKEE